MTTEDTWSLSAIQKAQLKDSDIRPVLKKKLKSADQQSRLEITQESLKQRDFGLFGTPYIIRIMSFLVSGRVMMEDYVDDNQLSQRAEFKKFWKRFMTSAFMEDILES
ncbi:hypothetical protein AVEN_151073-1 [Araneus ventricosus]|uniref:Uncharacterized protein n=1 Tax=Araneus ventricosus TaxID=182803 RepID=A0A4Y2QRL5_ARAVE|nr:hypothetical protein AVEN_151073-1 [Araneus ventricosus]